MEPFDVLVLRVRVEERGLESELTSPMADPDLQLDQGEGAVVLGVALPEHVQVDAVQHLDPVVGADHARAPARPSGLFRISSIACSSVSSGTSATIATSPGARSSTRLRRSPRRFL